MAELSCSKPQIDACPRIVSIADACANGVSRSWALRRGAGRQDGGGRDQLSTLRCARHYARGPVDATFVVDLALHGLQVICSRLERGLRECNFLADILQAVPDQLFYQVLAEAFPGSGKILLAKIERLADDGFANRNARSRFTAEDQLKDVNFRLEQFDKHGVKDKLEKQVSFNEDEQFCAEVEDAVQSWHESLDAAIDEADETINDLTVPGSKHNEPFFKKYKPKLDALKTTVADARKISTSLEAVKAQLRALGAELTTVKDGLKDEFAEVERKLVKLLAEQGVTSIQPNDYVALVDRKKGLAAKIADLQKKTTKEAGKRDALLKAVTRLNDAWLEEFKQLSTELGKINKAQGALQVQTIFKGDKAAFRDKLEETFRGHNIRKETYQTLAEQYPDFAHIYRDLGTAAAHAKGKSDILSFSLRILRDC